MSVHLTQAAAVVATRITATAANATSASSSSSCDVCGWMAAACAALAFGSFGVPIKSGVATQVNIDPLVMQTYKSTMVFLTSWFVLLDRSQESFHFTPWGIVSGLFWVPGGVATVYAIKAAGLAIGIGIGSSFIVLVSFVWGIFVFEEQIHSHVWACVAILLMVAGLFGMSHYSSPNEHNDDNDDNATGSSSVVYHLQTTSQDEDDEDDVFQDEEGDDTDDDANHHNNNNLPLHATNAPQPDGLMRMTNTDLVGLSPPQSSLPPQSSKLVLTDRTARTAYSDSTMTTTGNTNNATTTTSGSDVEDGRDTEPSSSSSHHRHHHRGDTTSGSVMSMDVSTANSSIQSHHVVMCGGVVITQRRLGMLAAVFCGIWGGSIMAPMKYSPADTKGVGFLISFAIGASIVTAFLWLVRFLYYWKKYESALVAYQNLPSFHFRKMWCAGATCGLLWSVGNFFSLFSVYYLGEGVGYPLVQTSILISGLWGIFYYKEVRGVDRISKWLLSSMLTVAGIILLSYEHHEK